MSKYNQRLQKTNSGMKSENRENVFNQANSMISNSHQKEVKNDIKIQENNKPNGSISSSKEIMDKLRYLVIFVTSIKIFLHLLLINVRKIITIFVKKF